MRHRTVTVFIVVLAVMSAAPQAFQQLSSLKDAAGNHLVAGVWSAFLSLHGQKVGGGARAQELPQTARRQSAAATARESLPQSAQSERRDARASKLGERAQAAPRAVLANVEEALGLARRELAMLGGLDELISVEAGPAGRVMVHAPKIPAAAYSFARASSLAPAATTAPNVEAYPAVFKLGKLMKGANLKHFPERIKVENVRRAAAAERAVEAEAPPAVESVWKFEAGRSPSRTPSCDEGSEEMTN